MNRWLPRSCYVVAFALGSWACSRTPAAGLRPATPTFAQAAAESGCAITEDRNEPFVVDWPADKRGDLEGALNRKLAVVAFECDRLRVLADCEVDGSYNYAAFTEKEQVIRLEDADELRANLPFSGHKLAGKLSADMERGTTLEIALAMVGKKTATRRLVLKRDLKGECTGATHFVRSATLGAFAMQTGTKAKVHSALDLFGGAVSGTSASSLQTESRDGALEACRGAEADGEKVVPKCAAPLRLELRAIRSEPPASREELDAQISCPRGFALTDEGKCASNASRLPHICHNGDGPDCGVQCDHGSMGSCAILGRMYQTGKGVPKSLEKAMPLFDRACKGGATPACGRIGELLLSTERRDEGMALLQKSCAAGFLPACESAFDYLSKNPRTKNVDVVPIVRRGCLAGDANNCASMAALFRSGLGVRKNDAEVLRWASLACEGGGRYGCTELAHAYQDGRGTVPDPAKAVTILRDSCERGASESCNELSLAYFGGQGVTKDDAEGVKLLTRACEGDDTAACFSVGLRYKLGMAVPKDPERALKYFNRACEAGLPVACQASRGP